jgi:hypothetical protein
LPAIKIVNNATAKAMTKASDAMTAAQKANAKAIEAIEKCVANAKIVVTASGGGYAAINIEMTNYKGASI